MVIGEGSELCRPRKRADRWQHVENVETVVRQFTAKPIARPATVVTGVWVVQPCAMGGKQKSTVGAEQTPAFAQIRVQVPDVLKHLEGNDAVGGTGRQRNGMPFLEHEIHAFARFKVAGQVCFATRLDQRPVRRVTCAEVHDRPVSGLEVSAFCKKLDGLLDASLQATQRIGIVARARCVESVVHRRRASGRVEWCVHIWRDRRWLRFVLVGGTCFLANLVVLYVGTDVLGWHYLVSMAASIAVANSLGWLLNRGWTFRSTNVRRLPEFARYLAVNLAATVVSLALMALLVSGLGVHYLLASALLAAVFMVINFIAHRDWSFAPRDQTRS